MPTPVATAATPRSGASSRGLARMATLALLVTTAGCFDSDDKFKSAPLGSTGESTGVLPPSDSTGIPDRPPVATGGTDTCRDALGCLNECIFSIQQQIFLDVPEPDLGCFLDCDPYLSVDEAVILINLFECAYNVCADDLVDMKTGQPYCIRPGEGTSTGEAGSSSSTGDASTSSSGGDGGSSSGSGSGSDSGSSSGGSSSSTGAPPPPPGPQSPLDACTQCVLTVVGDTTVTQCETLQAECT